MAEKIITVVRGSQLIPYIRHLEDRGTDPAIVLRQCSCPITIDYEDPHCCVPTKRFWQVIEKTAWVLKDPHTGWEVAMRYGLQGSRYLGYLLENQASLRHALEFYVDIISKHSNSATLSLETRDSELWLVRSNVIQRTDNFPQVEQYYMGLVIHIIQNYLGAEWQPTRISLCGTPDLPQRYPMSTHCGELATGEKQFGIAVPIDLLDEGPKKIPASISSPGPPVTPLPTENHQIFKELLYSYLKDYPLTRSSVSKVLQLHPRTLARLLLIHDINFSAIKNEVLMDRARVELESSSLSIGEVARLLGYSHQSAFTRAFEKQVGMPPKRYRAMAKPKDEPN